MRHLVPDPIRVPLLRRRLGTLSLALVPGLSVASPTGGQVVAGQASIASPGAGSTVITQNSPTAVIQWQQFNVGNQELVQFVQPSASAAILNRIVGGSPSEILGNLSANGRVFLINPQGLMFGAGSRVDVGGLVASTLDIKNEDFLAGRYVFAGNSGTGVLNQGQLRAAEGGFIVLAGDSSRNTGLIQARLGDVVLASGSAMTLDLANDGLVSVAVNATALTQAAGVSNAGELLADGGRVLMTADVARALVGTAVNNSGTVRATSLTEHQGEIVLAATGGNLVSSGTVDAAGSNASGGSVQLLGDRNLRLADASLRAGGSGNSGRITLRSTAESLSIDGSTLAAGNLDLQSATATAITDSSLDTGRSDTSSQLLIRGRGISLTEATLRAGTVTLTDSATLTLRSGSLTGTRVLLEAPTLLTPESFQVVAEGFGVRGETINLVRATLALGSGLAPFGDDEGLFQSVPAESRTLLPDSNRPNASFFASTRLLLGNIVGNSHYLLLKAPDIGFGGEIRGANDLLVHFIPGIADSDLQLSNLAFARFTRTLAVGSSRYNGDILIQSANGEPLRAGENSNLVFLTHQRVLGLDNIATNGRVLSIDALTPIGDTAAEELVLESDEFTSEDAARQDRNDAGNDKTDSESNSEDAEQQCDAAA